MVQNEAELQEIMEPANRAAAYWLWHHGSDKMRQYIGEPPPLPEENRRASRSTSTTTPPTSREEISTLFGVTVDAFEAAKKRLQRQIENDGHDQRTIGTPFEHQLLRAHAAFLAANGHAATTQQLTAVLVEMLEQRAAHAGVEGAVKLTPPEKAFLAKSVDQRVLAKSFWYRFIEEQNLSTGAIKIRDQQRAAWLNTAITTKHFSNLNKVLEKLDFLNTTGRYTGHIKIECQHRIVNADETTALTTPAFQAKGVFDPATATAAVQVGAEHNGTLTALLAFNLLGQFFMPFLIFAKKILTTEYLNMTYPFIISTATENAYIDAETLKAFARALRQQVGHAETILLIMDGHKTRLAAGVITFLAKLAIVVYLIPPHTSHALAPLDQYNQELHRLYCASLAGLQHTFKTMDEMMRLEAFYMALKKLSTNAPAVAAAWQRAGITREKRCVDFLPNKPRSSVSTATYESPPRTKAAKLLASPAKGQTVTLTVEQLRELRAAVNNSLSMREARRAEVQAAQAAKVEAEQKRITEILNQRYVRRKRVTKGVWGASTSEEVGTYLAELKVREHAAAARLQKKKDNAEREKPLLDELEKRGFAGGAKKITKKMLETALKHAGKIYYGSREDLILRLTQCWNVEMELDDEEIEEEDEGAVNADESSASEGDEQETAEEVAAAAEAAMAPMTSQENEAHQQLVNEAKAALAAESQVDMELIQELLASRTPSMQKWWEEQDALVGLNQNI